MQIKCQNCGADVKFGYTKCPACGAPINLDYKKMESCKKRKISFKPKWIAIICLIVFALLAVAIVFPQTTMTIKPYGKAAQKSIRVKYNRLKKHQVYKDDSIVISEQELAVYLSALNPPKQNNILGITDKALSLQNLLPKDLQKQENKSETKPSQKPSSGKARSGNEYAVKLDDDIIKYSTKMPFAGINIQYTVEIDLKTRTVSCVQIGDIPLVSFFKDSAMKNFSKIGQDPIFRFIMNKENTVKIKDHKLHLIFEPKK